MSQMKSEIKFIDSFINFVNKLTFENFKKNYLNITRKLGSEFLPEEAILKEYFDFIKSLKKNFGEGDIVSMLVAPRECYKSTTFSIVFPTMVILWSFKVNDDLSLVILGGNNEEKVKRSVFYRLKTALLSFDFEVIKNDSLELHIKKNNKELRVAVFHSKSDLRSYSFYHYRPQYIILDDIDLPVSNTSNLERLRLLEKFKAEWIPARMSGNSLIQVIGNFESQISILKHLNDLDFVIKKIVPYKIDGKYIKKNWNEEWEKQQIEIMGIEQFLRQYKHELPSDKYKLVFNKDVSGEVYALIDIGENEGNLVGVVMVGNTIIDIIYAGYQTYSYLIQRLREYDIEKIYFDANNNQIYLKEIFKMYFPTTKIIPMKTEGLKYTKTDKMLYALLNIENGNIKVHPDIERYLREEIEKIKSNSHVLDILGTFLILFFKESKDINIKVKLI
ncbi:MAG: hypothetical protein ACPL1F_00285 [bacterium]